MPRPRIAMRKIRDVLRLSSMRASVNAKLAALSECHRRRWPSI